MKEFLYCIFAISIFMPIYTYIIYPLILVILPSKKYVYDENFTPEVSVLIAAYNEEKVIREKIKNLENLNYPDGKIEFLIGSDGSADKTLEIAFKSIKKNNIKVIALPRGGKVRALNVLIKKAKGEILVFSDANTLYDRQAIKSLVKHFVDSKIGCVSGQLRYETNKNSGEGAKSENLYWTYENWVKEEESKIGRLSGSNGAIYAIRKKSLNKIKENVINDDFYVSTYILEKGYDVIMDKEAIAYEKPNDNLKDQFRRHVRDGAGHYQAILIFWRMLFPRKGSFTYVSHRVIKWLVPFSLIIDLIINFALIIYSKIMFVIFLIQIIIYFIILIYWLKVKKSKEIKGIWKGVGVLYYFISINFSLLLGFFNFFTNRQKAMWETKR